MQNTLTDATTYLQLYLAEQLDYCISIQYILKLIRGFGTPTILSNILFLLVDLSLLRKVICTPFRDSALLSAWPPTIWLHPFTLSIPKVARDQVWYKQPLFYNSNFSIPNGSASPFGEAQLDDTKLRSAAMAPGSSSRRNALPRSRLVPTPAPAKYTEEDLRTMTSSAWIHSSRLKPVVPNPQATEKALEKCKDHIDTVGVIGSNHTPFAALFFYGRISFRWHQYKGRSQAVVLSPWVEFKAFFWKSLGDSRASVYTTWSRIR